ncbi:MAG: cytosolic long-chain acyl-CoA thioester hydrolase family protein, partial [uncultured Rubrobacteraceae bacterium]
AVPGGAYRHQLRGQGARRRGHEVDRPGRVCLCGRLERAVLRNRLRRWDPLLQARGHRQRGGGACQARAYRPHEHARRGRRGRERPERPPPHQDDALRDRVRRCGRAGKPRRSRELAAPDRGRRRPRAVRRKAYGAAQGDGGDGGEPPRCRVPL